MLTEERKNTILNRVKKQIQEKDPKGKNPHESGAKLDAGKVRPYLVYASFIHALQEVWNNGTFGAYKYTANGWKEVENAHDRYLEAALRHFDKYLLGEDRDQDSNTHHLGAVAWNILAVLELELTEVSNKYNGVF